MFRGSTRSGTKTWSPDRQNREAEMDMIGRVELAGFFYSSFDKVFYAPHKPDLFLVQG